MKVRFGIISSILAVGMLAPIAALAHHGSAIYDETKAVVFTNAKVTEWLWANPHCLLEFDVKDDKGTTVHWTAEVSNPPDMIARGWSRKMFKAGDEVKLWVIAAKNGEPIGRIAQVEVGGKTFGGMGRVPGEAPAK
ncbi:MAG: DUF6152 family protein [Bryobacteraceae bacterium]